MDPNEITKNDWNRICESYKADARFGWSVRRLADSVDRSWYASRSEDTIKDFVELTWDEFQGRRGFGKGKQRKLLEILILGLPPDPISERDENLSGLGSPDVFEIYPKLKEVPLDLAPLSARALRFIEELQVQTVGDLLRKHADGNLTNALAHRNLGKRTLGEIEQILFAAQRGDLSALHEVLPVGSDGAPCPLRGLELYLWNQNEMKARCLEVRLCEEKTLEEVASVVDVTRERVRQIEGKYLDFVNKVLSRFPSWKEELFEVWKSGKNLFDHNLLKNANSPLVACGIWAALASSPQGKEWLEQARSLMEQWSEFIRQDWRFYTGQFRLDKFFENEERPDLILALAEYGVRQGIWVFDEETLTVIPESIVLKRAALAHLRHQYDPALNAERWLNELKACPAFEHTALGDLRNLYSNWKQDPDFAPFQIDFDSRCEESRRAGSRRRIESRPSETAITADIPDLDCSDEKQRNVPEERLITTPVFPNSKDLEELERCVVDAIATAGGDTILGLLIFPVGTEDRIIEAIRESLDGQARRFRSLFDMYPGVTASSLCIAIGRMEEHEFWSVIEKQLKIHIGHQRRQEISRHFEDAVKRLGLAYEYEDDRTGSVLLRPMIFQTGFPPYLIPRIRDLFGGTQLLPDPEDFRGLEGFCKSQAKRTAITGNLQRILNGPGGPFLVGTILRAFQTNKYDHLPPRLRDEVRTVLEATDREVLLKRPFLRFDSIQGEPVVVFPAIPRRLRTPSSKWVVEETSEGIPATSERAISADLFGDRALLEGRLRNLKDREDTTFSLPIAPTSNSPCLFFDHKTGRQVRPVQVASDDQDRYELASGVYYVWITDPSRTNDSELFEEHDFGWFGQVEIAPQMEAFEFSRDGEQQVQAFYPRLRPAIIAGPGEKICRTVEGDPVYNESYPSFTVYLPILDPGSQPEADLEVSVGDRSLTMRRIKSQTTEESHFATISLRKVIEEIVAAFPSGAYPASVIAIQGGFRVQRKFVIWKGLLRLTEQEGFVCSDFPSNLSVKKSSGIRFDNQGTICLPLIGTGDLELAFSDFVLQVPRPGVYAICESIGEPVPYRFRLPETQSERIVVQTDDDEAWEIYCNKARIGKVGEGICYSKSFDLKILAAEFGSEGKVIARSDVNEKVLFTYTLQKLAQNVRFEYDPGYGNHRGIFTVPRDYGREIRLKRRSLLRADLDDEVSEWHSLSEPQNVVFGYDQSWAFKLGIEPRREDRFGHQKTVVKFHSERSGGTFFDLVELEIRNESGEVDRLLLEDRGNPSDGLFIFSDLMLDDCAGRLEEGSWPWILARGFQGRDGFEDLDLNWKKDQISLVAGLLRNKFHRDVWQEIGWVRDLYSRMVRDFVRNPENGSRSFLLRVAVEGLAWRAQADLASVTSTLAIACDPEIAAQPASAFDIEASHGEVMAPFAFLGSVGRSGLFNATRDAGNLCPSYEDFFAHFDRAAEFSEGSAELPGQFEFDSWIHYLLQNADRVDIPKHLKQGNAELLSLKHLGLALTRFDRRLKRACPSETMDGQHPLVQIRSQLRTMENNANVALNGLRRTVRWPVYEEFGLPPIPWAESEFSRQCATVIFGLAAIMRLRANDHISADQFRQYFDRITSATTDNNYGCNSYTILISFGPELFAYSLLFWEIITCHE